MTSQAKIVVSAEDRASRVLTQVRGQLASTGASATQLAASAGLVGPAFGALASAAGLVAFVKNVADAVDALNDVADATGATIENLSGLERVARLNGGTLNDVSSILVKFNAALAASANPTSDAAGVFKALGLSAKELQAIDPAVALQRTAEALAGFADNGDKARVIQELFGKSVKEAAPFLKDLAEAGKLNATVTREQAEQAERFNKSLAALRVTVQDASRSLVGEMAVSLDSTIERVKIAAQSFGGLAGAIKAVLSGTTQFKDSPAEGLREYNRQLVAFDERIKAAREGTDGFAGRFSKERILGLEKERAEVAKVVDYYRLLLNAGNAGQGRGMAPGAGLPTLPALPGKKDKPTTPKTEIDESTQALARYVDQLAKEADKSIELTERQKALNFLRSIGVRGEIPQVRQLVLGLADEADERERGLGFAKAMTAEMARQKAEQDALDDALGRFSGRTADGLKRLQTTRLEHRLAAGEAFSPEELERIVKGIGGIGDAAEDTFKVADKSLERFAENVQDALGSTVEASLRGDFDSIGRLWGNLLVKMASQAIAADLSRALFGNLFAAPGAGVAGAGFGLLGNLVSSIFSFGPGRASGGSVNPMSMQPVNEAGFEMFSQGGRDWLLTGARGGKVTPAGALGGSAPVVIHMHNSFGAGVPRNEMVAYCQIIKMQTLAAVGEHQRRNFAMGGAA